jgi:hypothetical protein
LSRPRFLRAPVHFFSCYLELGAGLNTLGLRVVDVTAFALDSDRKDAMLIKQPAYVFTVVKKHPNPLWGSRSRSPPLSIGFMPLVHTR